MVTVKVDNLHKRFCRDLGRARRYGAADILTELAVLRPSSPPALRPGEFWALENVSLVVHRGEALGVLGPNGAGKTTLLRVLHGLSRPDGGSVTIAGTSMALIDLGSSFVGALTGRENIESEAVLLGLDPTATRSLVERVAAFAELGAFLDSPVDHYSTGMRLRLAFSIAAQAEPDVLLVDETIAVGDINFQRKCVRYVRDYLARGGSLVLVSHDLWMINALCDRAVIMSAGAVTMEGTTAEAVVDYTRSLPALPAVDIQKFDRDAGTPDELDPAPPSPQLTIDNVAVSATDGGNLSFGQPAVIRLTVQSTTRARGVGVHLVIRAANRQTSVAATVEPTRSPGLDLQAGTNEVLARIPNFPLVGGTFVIEAALTHKASGRVLAELGTAEDVVVLDVASGSTEFETFAHMAGSMGSMPCSFTTRRDS